MSRPGEQQLIDIRKLRPVLGRMKVWELAQIANTTVEEMVAKIVRVGRLPRSPGKPGSKGSTERRSQGRGTPLVAVIEAEPDLGALLRRATRQEVKAIVDGFVIGRVLEQNDWIISRSAAQLRTSRRMLRKRWRAVHDLPIESLSAGLEGTSPSPDIPAAPSLRELVERQASIGEIDRVVDRWLVDSTLLDQDGNVTEAARRLKVSRRVLRKVRDGS